jgi:hypothetical protein
MGRWWHFVLVAAAGALVFLVVQSLYNRWAPAKLRETAVEPLKPLVAETAPAQSTGMGGKKSFA